MQATEEIGGVGDFIQIPGIANFAGGKVKISHQLAVFRLQWPRFVYQDSGSNSTVRPDEVLYQNAVLELLLPLDTILPNNLHPAVDPVYHVPVPAVQPS